MNLKCLPINIPPAVWGQGFGVNPSYYAALGMKGHNGQDFPAPLGTPVYAAHDGAMEQFTDDNGYGINARIMFDDPDRAGYRYEIIYGHFQRYEGNARPVKAGEIIGYVDSTGFSTGNHLHFGIRKWGPSGVLDYNNGYFGCFDPGPYLKGIGMNTFVETMNYNGTIGVFVPTSDKIGLPELNNIFNINLVVNPDGTIDTDKHVKDA